MRYVYTLLKAEQFNLKVFLADTKQRIAHYRTSDPERAAFWKKQYRTTRTSLHAVASALAILKASKKSK
jgi:hypothetical protein